jgi:sugar lactone lactonase YvrE
MRTGQVWKNLVSLVVIALVFSYHALSQGNLQGPVIENIGGIRIVHNKEGGFWGRGLKITLDLALKIGDINAEDEQFAFHYPSDIAVDKEGNIHVLDTGNTRIQKFSPDGKYLATIGRKGQGPGEFMMPDGLDFDPEGGLIVSDGMQSRIQAFPGAGKNIRKDIRIVVLRDQSIRGLRTLQSGNYVSSLASITIPTLGGQAKRLSEVRLLKMLTPDGRVTKEFGQVVDFGETLTNEMGNACAFDVDNQDSIYLCFLFQNRIEKFNHDGTLIWRADRPLSYSTEVKRKGWLDRSGQGGLVISPEMNACSTSIAVDDKRRIWVVTYARQLDKKVEGVQTSTAMLSKRGGGGVIGTSIMISGNTDLRSTDAFKLEVFSPGGELLGEIPLTHFADVIRIHRNNLFIIDREHGGTIYVYRIVEK